MSTGRAESVASVDVRERVATARTVLVRAVVGDRLGLVVFLGTLLAVGVTWRVGVFITDNYTLANALVALADGSLVVDEAVYGSLEAPGMNVHDGRLYGRNYGQVAVAVPLLWGLRAVTAVADLGLVFAAGWSLLLLAFAVQVGQVTGRESTCATTGAVLALASFAASAALAEPIPPRLLPLAALQLGTVLATALVATTVYRLLARMHDRRLGIAAAVASVLATPVGFWAAIPKRHVTVTALLVGVVYAFYRSRSVGENTDDRDALLSPTGFRALAYALVGLYTWVHAGEAFAVFLALVAVDLPTAPSNDRRTLAVVGTAFAASLVPFFATNAAISGDPVRPPRMLSEFAVSTDGGAFGEAGSGGGGGTGGATSDGSPPLLPAPVRTIVATAAERSGLIFGPFVAGAKAVVSDPESLYRTFVRAGYDGYIGARDNDQAINLSVLESAPVLAGVAALVATGGRRATDAVRGSGTDRGVGDRLRRSVRAVRTSPVAATDAFVALVAVLFTLIYIPRLPLFAQVTVRYLLPVYVLTVYALARQPWMRRVLAEHGRAALWSYLGGVLLGAQLVFVAVTVGSFGRGGAFQLHAVVGLVVGVAFAVSVLGSALDERVDSLTAVTGGLAAALGTDLALLSAFVYFRYGPHVLPVADWLTDLLASA
ncbi:hypothetical protein I7X12_16155 [Halosimplex litoreum]|uniref:Uncharacterized protein n=1 Tax=Halosimplex litoreum TaxID=1198301 RepID=A0A7T3FXS8_9EURY|nr:hypothetical protein [Halosimplex litoreum]QPV62258.1 hypothetical protein I7X12_16155 [Halosimplex litoreum]